MGFGYMLHKDQVGRDYLFVPMQPTPNGRLHIGHASGPYLRADVLARDLRRRGAKVAIVTGSDGYENWVELAAELLGKDVRDTCGEFHRGIHSDLLGMGVGLDAWINPTVSPHRDAYFDLHEMLVRELRRSGNVTEWDENILFSPSGRAVIGPWLVGNCPSCGAPAGGNTCVACGLHFQPEEMVRPRSRTGEEPLHWKMRRNLFLECLRPDKIVHSLRDRGLHDRFLAPVNEYLDMSRGRVRLSNVGKWGVLSDEAPLGGVLSNTYFGYALYCGQVYYDLLGEEGNPFEVGRDVQTFGFFGTDNSIAGLVAPAAICQSAPRFRQFDAVVVNHMLHFEGQKCSTSKRHGVWISEALEAGLTPDELRFALSAKPLDLGVASVTLDEIVASVNFLRGVVYPRLAATTPDRERAPTWDGALLNRLEWYASRQAEALRPSELRLDACQVALDEWLRMAGTVASGGEDTWILGIAYLAEPLAPGLSERAKNLLGITSVPWEDVLSAQPGHHRPSEPLDLPLLNDLQGIAHRAA